MTSCVLNSCCGGIPLRAGCLIIGYLELVARIGIIYVLALIITGSPDAVHDLVSDLNVSRKQTVASAVVLLLGCFFFLAANILLLVGVHKNKRRNVKVYLITNVASVALFLIVFLANFNRPVILGDVIIGIIYYIVSVYFLLVVRSYYYKMDDGNAPTVRNTA